MNNGNITKMRVIIAGIIGLITVIGAIILIYFDKTVGIEFYGLAILALAGVVGPEIAEIVVNRPKT